MPTSDYLAQPADFAKPSMIDHVLEPVLPSKEGKIRKWFRQSDEKIQDGFLGRFFQFSERKTTFWTELRAGLVCFMTVCYIIPVNSGILADSGGSCDPAQDCNSERYELIGGGCVFDNNLDNPEWHACIAELKANLISATCIASAIGTIGMSLIANMPVAVAPAMGVNAYFSYTVVGFMGTGMISYEAALAAAFIEGIIFTVLTVSGFRQKFTELLPQNLLYATSAGIGAFLSFVGLQKSEGLGLISFDGATLVTLGGCPPEEQAHMYTMRDWDQYWMNTCWNAWRTNDTANNLTCGNCFIAKEYLVEQQGLSLPVNMVTACQDYVFGFDTPTIAPDVQLGLPARSSNYACLGGELRSATLWLGICGGVIMVLCMLNGVAASILWGLLFVTFISWIPTESNKATYFKEYSSIPGGEARYEYFRKGVTLPSLTRTAGKLDFKALGIGETWIALITFLYLDFMDATCTMYAMASLINDALPGFLDWKGRWPRQMLTMSVDGVSIIIGSVLGTSPLTIFAESSVGIKEGGRTGLTAFCVGCGFAASMFFAPIFSSIPPFATGPAIVFVGALMFEHARYVEWHDIYQAVPAFLTIILMPLTFSIAYGILGGILVQLILWLFMFLLDTIRATVFKQYSFYEVWLRYMSSWYCVFNQEQKLIDHLPGYVPRDPMYAADPHHHVADTDDSVMQKCSEQMKEATVEMTTANTDMGSNADNSSNSKA